MGCDIHMTLEIQGPKDPEDWWWDFANLSVHRDYILFAALGNDGRANNPSEVILPAKGLPEHMGMVTQWDECDGWETWKLDAHHESWATYEEARSVLDYLKRVNRTPDRWVDFEAIVRMMETFEALGTRTRLVYWFDN